MKAADGNYWHVFDYCFGELIPINEVISTKPSILEGEFPFGEQLLILTMINC